MQSVIKELVLHERARVLDGQLPRAVLNLHLARRIFTKDPFAAEQEYTKDGVYTFPSEVIPGNENYQRFEGELRQGILALRREKRLETASLPLRRIIKSDGIVTVLREDEEVVIGPLDKGYDDHVGIAIRDEKGALQMEGYIFHYYLWNPRRSR